MYSQLDQGDERHEPTDAASPGRQNDSVRSSPENSVGRGGGRPLLQGATPAPHQEQSDARTCRDIISDLLDKPESSFIAQLIHFFIIFVILASTASVILETVPELHANPVFFPAEMCITAIFTIEFALRLYACDSLRAFATNGFNIIDLLAIFPGYIELFIMLLRAGQADSGNDYAHTAASSMRTLRMIRFIRLVRVFRVLRLAKVARHSQLLSIIFAVFVKVSQSGLVVVLMLMCFAMILSASLVYLFESELCEDSGLHCEGPSAFTSIPASFWWAISTLTTVGYGDMVPHTVAGKIIGGLTAVSGVIVVAIGIALVSINFREIIIEEQARAERRRRGGPAWPESRPKEEQEVEDLLGAFDACSSALMSKLRSLATRQDEGPQLAVMLDVLSSHTNVLTSDVKVFMKQVLALHDVGGAACVGCATARQFSE